MPLPPLVSFCNKKAANILHYWIRVFSVICANDSCEYHHLWGVHVLVGGSDIENWETDADIAVATLRGRTGNVSRKLY